MLAAFSSFLVLCLKFGQKTVGQLREKARRAIETGIGAVNDLGNSAEKGIDLGLSLLAGSARVVRSTSKLSSSAVSSGTPTTSDSPASAPAGELHPALLEDMNSVFERVFENYSLYPGGSPIPLQQTSSPATAAGVDAMQGLSDQSPYQQTFSGYENMSPMPQMYQDHVSNQVSELSELQQQPQPQPAPSLEMLTTAYGYPTMQQQPSWPGIIRGQGYQTEENYPDDGAWQGLVADLGITT